MPSSGSTGLVLHAYWRSGASYRARIGLNLKGLAYEVRPVNLLKGEQSAGDYRAIDPQGLLPALEADGTVLVQSLAILEWLEETFPAPPLLPGGAADRALVRGMAAMVACDVQPLNNLRVLRAIRRELSASEDQVVAWQHHWIAEGFAGLERLIERHGAGFCFGDAPTLADCCLVPQVYAARRVGAPMADFPRIAAVADRCNGLDPFARAHPDRQPDAVPG